MYSYQQNERPALRAERRSHGIQQTHCGYAPRHGCRGLLYSARGGAQDDQQRQAVSQRHDLRPHGQHGDQDLGLQRPHRRTPGGHRPRREDPRQRLGIPRCAADQRSPHPHGRSGGRLRHVAARADGAHRHGRRASGCAAVGRLDHGRGLPQCRRDDAGAAPRRVPAHSGREKRAPQFSVRPFDAYLQHAAHGGFPRGPVSGGH